MVDMPQKPNKPNQTKASALRFTLSNKLNIGSKLFKNQQYLQKKLPWRWSIDKIESDLE